MAGAVIEEQKLAARIEELAKFARDAISAGATGESVFSVLADCRNALTRERKRAKTLSGELERVEIVPMRGATIEFTGRMLRLDEFDTARGTVRLEIWQTEAGALVAVDSLEDGEGGEKIKYCTPTGEIEDQRRAIMEFFGWSNRARSMARKLGWSLRVDVD